MQTFHILCEDEAFSLASVTALENALQGFVETDVTLAIEFLFVDEAEIRRLNREMRDTDRVTDVLSFPTLDNIKGQALQKARFPFDIDENGVIAVCMNKEELAKVQLGQEIILKGTRAVRLKDGSGDFGQANLDACEILVNNYGSHDYSTASFIENMTLADVYGLSAKEDHGTEVYVVTATVKVVDAQYYSNIYLVDGDTELLLYCSSSTQYSWLKAYAGQSVTVELAPCNWNSKGSYRGCVLAVRNADGTKTCNELNFSK